MPVVGHLHKHIWQYRHWARPLPVIDRDWDTRDRLYERRMVERLRQGRGLHTLSVQELVGCEGSETHGGWEIAETKAKDANRNGSLFLNDYAISRRLPDRELKKAAFAEAMELNRVLWEKESARRKEKEAAEAEAKRAAHEKAAKYYAERRRREAEWLEAQEEDKGLLQRQAEERMDIMSRPWLCLRCQQPATIAFTRSNTYILTCEPCRIESRNDHATMRAACRNREPA